MRALFKGLRGADVKKWQYFLAGQGFNKVIADGVFGPITSEATKFFQQQQGLVADGIVGTFTLSRAGILGFELVKNPPGSGKTGDNWPEKPVFRPFSQKEYQQRFGPFSWKLKTGHNPGREIEIKSPWAEENLVFINTPLLAPLPPYKAGRMRVHKKVAGQFENLFQQWEKARLKLLLLTYDGGFYPRMIRGSDSQISAHSYGIAFDINAQWNGLGRIPPKTGEEGSVRELVEIAHENGFYWGGHFTRKDGMHFEVAKIL